MRAIDIDTLEWFQIKCVGFDEPMILIRKPHILELDIIEAEPVRHGRWETDREDIEWGNSLKRKHCTNCGSRPHFDKEKREFVLTNYCPACGAKMDLK